MWLPPVAFLFTLASPTLAKVKELWWNITYVNDINPDGRFPRRVVGINGSWPPPPIEVTTDDILVVNAFNSLSDPTTLHAHGMFFNRSTWYDGAEAVGQCGIPPGQTYQYIVPINSSGQWGTYWIHGHAGGQYVDGLRAPLVIHPPKEVYSYDEEFTVIISDWYHQEHAVLIKEYLNVSNPTGAEPVPESPLIYFAHNGKYLPPIPGRSTPSPHEVGFNTNATLPFEPGKTYRLRIINQGAFAALYLWIDGHNMTIIEVDGTDVEESYIDILNVAVAQRYSVLVTARNETDRNWAIHANLDTTMFDTQPKTLWPNTSATITYNTSPDTPLTNLSWVKPYHDVNDTALVPVKAEPMLPKNHTMDLVVSFAVVWDGTNRGMFNEIYYVQPRLPSDLRVFQLGPNAMDPNGYGNASYVIPHLTHLEIVLKNGDTGGHPFHLHGHKFQIVGRSPNFTSSDLTLSSPVVQDQANPIRRDTVQVPAGASVTLRFVADNPGTWIFHCHIEWHLFAGLALVFIEAPFQLQKQAQFLPKEVAAQCSTTIPGLPAPTNVVVDAPPSDLSGRVTELSMRSMLVMIGCLLIAVFGMRALMRYARGRAHSDVRSQLMAEMNLGQPSGSASASKFDVKQRLY